MASEMNGHGHDFGYDFLSESVSEADSDTDTRFFGTSDGVCYRMKSWSQFGTKIQLNLSRLVEINSYKIFMMLEA